MRILCATDLLPRSESAIERAGMLADLLDADLSLLHVVTPLESARGLAEDLRHASLLLHQRTEPPVWRYRRSPAVQVRTGSAGRILIEALRDSTPDLLVLGSQRRSRIRTWIAQTIAARVLAERLCPVLIVNRMPWGVYRRIVLAVDSSLPCGQVIRVAESTVLTAGVQASIVHGSPTDVPGDGTREAVAESLRRVLAAESRDISRYLVEVENATPLEAIHNVVRRRDPDLLILGTRGHGRLRRALLGSVAHRVLSRIGCDLLVVPDRTRPVTPVADDALGSMQKSA